MNRKKPVPVTSASASIDAKIQELGDWRGKTLARVRALVHAADPEIVEEWKWLGTPVWSHGGDVCTGETYKKVVKLTFSKGAALEDPSGLFNSSLEGKVRRAIDIHEGDELDAAALKALVRAAVAHNLEGQKKKTERSKPARARKAADSSSSSIVAVDGGRFRRSGWPGASRRSRTTWSRTPQLRLRALAPGPWDPCSR